MLSRWSRYLSGLMTFVLGVTLVGSVYAETDTPPGELLTHPSALALSGQSLSESVNEYGRISLSLDALGTLNASGQVQVNKPVGGTVRRAFLLAATTGARNIRLATGDVALEGNSVVWSQEVASSIDSYNYWADVTELVRAKLDAAAPGQVDLTITESNTANVDGEIMVVIFNDPGQLTNNTILLYFGAQNVSGDSFVIDLAAPIDVDDPNFFLNYSLGISYGYQVSGVQYSLVDVNGTRLTSSAGGEDDGASANGALITVGGIGDTTANPADPNATPVNARSDDEYYDLEPFVQDGDTSITIDTRNPSADDNILFAALMMGATRAVGSVDVNISLYNNPSTALERAPYEAMIGWMADGVYESSNAAHRLGTVTFYPLSGNSDTAHINWTAACHPNANISGYGHEGLHINMCDVFTDGDGPGQNYDFLEDSEHQRGGGYTLAHEWGHFFYSVYDEYRGNGSATSGISVPRTSDKAVPNSIMHSQWNAVGGNLEWLNFSTTNNDTKETAQHRVYGASAWETLVRPLSEDPREGAALALPERIVHSELRDVAPDSADWIVTDLPGDSRNALRIVWQTPITTTLSDAAAASNTFDVHLESLGGQNISYPKPIVLLAYVHRDLMITDLNVQGRIQLPGGEIQAVAFADDGVAPDAIASDGLYSAVVGYTVNGVHRVEVSFDNTSNQAKYVSGAFLHSVDTNGQAVPAAPPVLVNESMALSRSVEILVANVVPDDYGNAPALAQTAMTDNVAWPGRMDTAEDADVFAVTTAESGLTYLRVTDLALGMDPHVRIFASDGVSLLFETNLQQQATKYIALALRGVTPQTKVYVEITQEGAGTVGGTYKFSVGSALASDVYSTALYLPMVRR